MQKKKNAPHKKGPPRKVDAIANRPRRSAVKIVRSEELSSQGSPRFIIVNPRSKAVLDNAGGYGYKSAESARKAWEYQHKGSKASQPYQPKLSKERVIAKWLSNNRDFMEEIQELQAHTKIEYYGAKYHFTEHLVQQVMDTHKKGNMPFTAKELWDYLQKLDEEAEEERSNEERPTSRKY